MVEGSQNCTKTQNTTIKVKSGLENASETLSKIARIGKIERAQERTKSKQDSFRKTSHKKRGIRRTKRGKKRHTRQNPEAGLTKLEVSRLR